MVEWCGSRVEAFAAEGAILQPERLAGTTLASQDSRSPPVPKSGRPLSTPVFLVGSVLYVRELDSSRDSHVLADLVITLQNDERQFDPGMPEGCAMVQAYVGLMLARCARWDGTVFVAEDGDRVIGFVCVWARVPSEEPDDNPSDYAFVSDLVVEPAHRHRGVGRELMSAAENYARARGARRIRLGVLARNRVARDFYESMNYLEREIELEKRLERGQPRREDT
jgi:ribosomal protein S18 acetylase RimI-like enzyme